MTKIVGISGSLREGSYNSALLRAGAALAPKGVSVEIAGIGDIPLYNEDVKQQGFPAAVEELASAIRAADGVWIATPEYNYSIPGVLKNAIDWVSRVENQPFAGKPVAIMGASLGRLGTARSQYHLRQVMVFVDAIVMNKPEVFVGGAKDLFEEGELTDETTRDFLDKQLGAFLDWIAKVG